VRGIKLKDDDNVIEVAVVGEKDEYVFIITEKGM
jgi:hypothetical protein